MSFQVHTVESAPSASREPLSLIVQKYGYLPNLAGVFAESPAALRGLLGAMSSYDGDDFSLMPLERQVALLSTSVTNRCEYCTAAHSMLAHIHGLERAEIESVQSGRPLTNDRLEAVRRFTEDLIEARGRLPEKRVDEFIAAGFTRAEVFEVIFGVALKTLTNYANHIAQPPVNAQFAQFLPGWAEASDGERALSTSR